MAVCPGAKLQASDYEWFEETAARLHVQLFSALLRLFADAASRSAEARDAAGAKGVVTAAAAMLGAVR
jgi:hypothetical protein